MTRTKLLCALLLSPLLAFGQAGHQSDWGLPSSPGANERIILHSVITIQYDLGTNAPDWVAEYLTKEMVESEAVQRKGFDFADDPLIEGEATDADYTKSGFDRGHMAPAEDMEMDARWMSDCFMMSNMAPQKHALNGGRWKQMEEIARQIALTEGEAWIYSGTIFRTPAPGECSGSFGRKHIVQVPPAFFKVVVFRSAGKLEAVAFEIPHLAGPASAYGTVDSYLTSIDNIEDDTGLDFLNDLPPEQQAPIESTLGTVKAVWLE